MTVATTFNIDGSRVFVAGHRGMVGAALVRRLQSEGCTILIAERNELDLGRQDQVERWMSAYKPDLVFVAAAKVGGIYANNTRPAEFLYENLMIEANLIHAA
jgi:GDP-L-fucose synthase